MSCGRPAIGTFEPKAARTTFRRRVAAFAAFAPSTAVTVTVLGPRPVIAGAAIGRRKVPAASARAVTTTAPPIATVASGVNVVPVTTSCWPEAKHVPVTLSDAAAALWASSARTTPASGAPHDTRRMVRRIMLTARLRRSGGADVTRAPSGARGAERPRMRRSASGACATASGAERSAGRRVEQRAQLVGLGHGPPAREVLAHVRRGAAVDRRAALHQRDGARAVARPAGEDEMRAKRLADDRAQRRHARLVADQRPLAPGVL